MRCVWLEAWEGAARMVHGENIGIWQVPVDRRNAGRSTWLAVMNGDHPGSAKPAASEGPGARSLPSTQGARQPGPLESRLRPGRFCVTAEFNPPDTTDPEAIYAEAQVLLDVCDSVNVTDGAGANTHISSLSVCALLARRGCDPVMQISCRDRNRIAAQSDALGAAALGIRNILCLTGDGIEAGDEPGAKPVFDLDCMSLLRVLRDMRDEGRFSSGRRIAEAPDFFLGATSNPCALPPDIEVDRIAKKIACGAQFIQTQFCFDFSAFKTFFDRFHDRGLHEQCRFLVGIGPLASAKRGRWMRNNIAGVRIPDSTIERLERAADQRREGVEICVELIRHLSELEGVAGVHIMAFRRPEVVQEIVERSGLRPPAAAQ